MTRARGLVGLLLLLASSLPATAQPLTREEQAAFLRTAKVVNAAPIGSGTTRPWRLTLSDGQFTHDAAFQSVDERRSMSFTGPRRRAELRFTDSWRFNIAAHRLAVLLGIGDMVPVSVERSWDGKIGAYTWWVDDVLVDEMERRKQRLEPPDEGEWTRQNARMHVFTELAHDTDRNQGNILITKDWRLVMIDFTRAFRSWDHTPNPLAVLRRCDRRLYHAMRALTKESLVEAVGKYLTSQEANALLARRTSIIAHFDQLIARLGEDDVLY